MKTPERALTEYASDAVECFHGHRATWRDFETCCDIFRINYFGIYPCFWHILRHKGLDEAKIKALDAVVHILKMGDLGAAAIRYGHTLSERVAARHARFFDPRHLLLYENVEEVKRDMPSIKEDILEVAPGDEPLSVAEKCYTEGLGTRISYLRHYVSAGIANKSPRNNIDLVTIRNDSVQKTYTVSTNAFVEYLEVLSGRKVKNLEVEDGQTMNFDAPPASFRVALADGSRCNLLLYSLVTFECLGV